MKRLAKNKIKLDGPAAAYNRYRRLQSLQGEIEVNLSEEKQKVFDAMHQAGFKNLHAMAGTFFGDCSEGVLVMEGPDIRLFSNMEDYIACVFEGNAVGYREP